MHHMIFSDQFCTTNCSFSKNLWMPRSFCSYSSRQIMLQQPLFQNNRFEHHWHGSMAIITQYMQNFTANCHTTCNNNLGSFPFWSGSNIMTIGNNHGTANLDAYQLGLGNVITDENGIAGTIQLNPTVQHIGSDIMLYLIQDTTQWGIFFKLNLPIGAMIINPRFTEPQPAKPDNQFNFTQTTANPASSTITYQFPFYPPPACRQSSISEAFFGGTCNDNSLNGNVTQFIRLRKARIAAYPLTIIRLGDITASLGCNVISNNNGFCNIAFKSSFPTGNVPTADYMLEPIFGRAGSWGVGAELFGSYHAWTVNDTTDITMYIQAEILHLLPGRKPNFRCFDLKKNGPGSKYLLVQEYISTYSLNNPPTPSTQIVTDQYLTPAANITTLPVISKTAAEGSIAIMIDIHNNNWNFSLGGECWGRTEEQLSIDMKSALMLRNQNLNDFAVIGRQVSWYRIDGQGNLSTYYCEPEATISKSQNPVQLIGSINTVSAPETLPTGIKDARLTSNRIPANVYEALDIKGAQATPILTGNLFAKCNYTWKQSHLAPSIAIIINTELTGATNNNINLWGIGCLGSLNF